MPLVDVVDESFVYADPARVATLLADPRVLRGWFPALELEVVQDRGPQGMRWAVTGALVGTAEVWLERWGPGTVVHYFLHTDLSRPGRPTDADAGSPRLARRATREVRRRQRGVKAAVWALKDALEGDRPAGVVPGLPPGPAVR